MHPAWSAGQRDDIVRVVAPEIASMTSGIAAESIVKLALKYILSAVGRDGYERLTDCETQCCS
jgi:hypothetical protein